MWHLGQFSHYKQMSKSLARGKSKFLSTGSKPLSLALAILANP
jgi:hypothetical protein